jgi:hypothetical protein
MFIYAEPFSTCELNQPFGLKPEGFLKETVIFEKSDAVRTGEFEGGPLDLQLTCSSLL